MYPSIPVGAAVSGSLARTGFSVAAFLTISTILIITGLLLLRTSRVMAAGDAES